MSKWMQADHGLGRAFSVICVHSLLASTQKQAWDDWLVTCFLCKTGYHA